MGFIGMNVFSSVLKTALGVIDSAVKDSKSSTAFKTSVQKAFNIEQFKPLIFKVNGTSKVVNPSFERFSQNYINAEPEIICIAEYFVDGKSIGSLIVWEKFHDSTHYEVFKKNIFKESAEFERILFLDSKSLEEETKYYVDYLTNTLGIHINEKATYVVLDTLIKEDRIYEYKVRAARVPKTATEVDYDFIMESKDLSKIVTVDTLNQNNLFDFAGINLGSKDLAWTIALLNETVPFFGRNSLEKNLAEFLPETEDGEEGERSCAVANNLNDIMAIMNDSFLLFEERSTFEHLLRVLGGLGSDFRSSFLDSIDETRNVFSYDNYKNSIKAKIPVYSLILQIVESSNNKDALDRLSKLSITIPNNKGSESLTAIENITKILKFVNDTYISLLYAQDKETSIEVQKILDDVKKASVVKVDTIQAAVTKAGIITTTTTAKTGSNTVTSVGSNASVASNKSSSSSSSSSGGSTKTVSGSGSSSKKKTTSKGKSTTKKK